MSLTQAPPKHPAEFSPEIIDFLRGLLPQLEVQRVHDPFAGRGRRLGALCDELGLIFTGTDVEEYEDRDPRVVTGDSTHFWTYPSPKAAHNPEIGPFCVVTSPVYLNRISTDYVNGPTPQTKVEGRRAYGISLGKALSERNLARTARSELSYYRHHGMVVAQWPGPAVVNVDEPMTNGWIALLLASGFQIERIVDVKTRRYRGPANSDKRPENEVVIVASRS